MSRLLSKLVLVAIAGSCGIALAGPTLTVQAMTPSPLAQSEGEPEAAPADSPRTLVDVASQNNSFQTLVAAVEAAGLVETLSGEGPFTILAPPDSAFEELPSGVLAALLKPENKDLLTQILTYHVVPEKLMFNQFRSGGLATLNGGLAVKLTPERIVINNASIIQADVEADNGVIQVISRVLIPTGVAEELQARMAAASEATAPEAAAPETTAPETSSEATMDEAEDEAEKPAVRGLW